jgi:hypothetical protein
MAYILEKEYEGGIFIVVDNWESGNYDEVTEPIFSSDGKSIIYGAKIGNELWCMVDEVK